MKYDSWEDMVDAQARAFCALCAQNERLTELAEKADDGYDHMTEAEQDELMDLWDDIHNNLFFSRRCMKEEEELDMQEHPDMQEEEPNSWDIFECESYHDCFDNW